MTGPTLTAPDDDPFLWLEDIEGDAACAWADAQSAATLAKLDDARCKADTAALLEIFDRPDRIPLITRRGGLLYNFWRDAAHPRGLWRRTTMESYRTDTPDWDILLDLDALATKEGVDWVWQGADTLPPGHGRAMLHLSRGGSDAVVLREFDVETKDFIPRGFAVPEAKGGTSWIDQDTLLLSSAFGEGNTTESGYARTVRLWQRGTDPIDAPVIHSVPATSMSCWASYDRPGDRVIFVERPAFFRSVVWLGDRTGAATKLDLPDDVWVSWHQGFMVVRPRSAWAVQGVAHAPDTVLGIGMEAFLVGARDFRVLFTPAPRQSVQGFFWSGPSLIISALDDLKPLFLRVTPVADWAIETIPGLPAIGTVNLWSLDADEDESDGTMLVSSQTPLIPPTLSLLAQSKPAVLRQSSEAFDPRDAMVTRHEAIAADGERIPYVQVGPPGLTGDAPVHLGGYGGFRVSRLPVYASTTGKLWLEKGGTTVVANIRGGGEFGTAWHDAGRLAGKKTSHDDFAAVADDLVKRGVTRPARIAAEGGSNGGLLIANMLTRHPEKFGALFCTIPLIDMRRYHKLLAGASWMAEYGDPENPDAWAFLGPLSAYHVAQAGRPYPPILIATSRRDDRVHPGHARKFAAKLQSLGYDALFYEPAAGGHGYGKDNAEVARFAAMGMKFLRRAIGWDV